MITCYITFGQKYRREQHPIDGRQHPDGWFEYEADTYGDALAAAAAHLMGDDGYAMYAFDYDEHNIQRGYYPRGCLARFRVDGRGGVREVTS